MIKATIILFSISCLITAKTSIPHCEQEEKDYCNKCAPGYINLNRTLDPDLPENKINRTCVKCPPHCLTCNITDYFLGDKPTLNCMSCSKHKKLDRTLSVFGMRMGCVYNSNFKLGVGTFIVIFAVGVLLVFRMFVCARVAEMERMFVIKRTAARNFVDVQALMSRPAAYQQDGQVTGGQGNVGQPVIIEKDESAGEQKLGFESSDHLKEE